MIIWLHNNQKPGSAGKGSRRVVDKWKKKKWFSINASRIFDKKPIANTCRKTKKSTNRTIRTTLDVLTGNRMKRDWYIYLKTTDVQGQNISTNLSKFEINKGTLGRAVRRRNSKIALTEKIPVTTGEARFTIVAITDRKATRRQEAGIREIMKKELLAQSGKDFEDISKDLLLGNLSSEIAKKAAKVFLVKSDSCKRNIY